MNIGIGEMIVIAAIALVVIGPEKFPDFAKIVIRTFRDVRGYVNDAKSEIAKELKPLNKEFKELGKYEPEKYIDTLAKGISEAASGEQGTDKSQPVAPVETPAPAADPAPAEEDPYVQKQEPGTQPYGGSTYSSAHQGEKYQGPERIDG